MIYCFCRSLSKPYIIPCGFVASLEVVHSHRISTSADDDIHGDAAEGLICEQEAMFGPGVLD